MKPLTTDLFLKNWRARYMLFSTIFALLLLLASVALISYLDLPLPTYVIPCLGLAVLGFTCYKLRPTKPDAIRFLHESHADLEYSLQVFEKEEDELNALQLLQKKRIASKLANRRVRLPSLGKVVKWSSIISLISLALLFIGLVDTAPTSEDSISQDGNSVVDEHKTYTPDSAYIDRLRLGVRPPTYTGMGQFSTKSLGGTFPEGSMLTWNYRTNGPLSHVNFYFNDAPPTVSKKKKLEQSSIYYYAVVDSSGSEWNSPYFSLGSQEDKKPEVEISGIEEYQKLKWKKNHDIDFSINISDDYGIEDAFISATVADGAGESVKFREKTFPLKNHGSSDFSFSTGDFEMEPGSELYFYVMAKDNCPFRIQATKSTTYFVVLEDTTSYDFAEDAGMQVDLMPDFFRSQRQIIIDTEQLMADKNDISELEFKKRSNELGFDQKMLRLKYGQFLGEEAESGIALENEIEQEDEHDHDHHHDHDHDHHDHEEAGKVAILEEYGHAHDHEAEEGILLAENGTRQEDPSRPDWVEELSHSHDKADENTYFEISLKGKLKAALSVMWDSELHLRLYNPSDALPYQYTALDFLQEIKNHARIYVHRIGFDPPSIKVAEKRLSGEMDKIVSAAEEASTVVEDHLGHVKKAFEMLSSRSTEGYILSKQERALIELAGQQMAVLAVEQVGLLPSLSTLRQILSDDSIIERKDHLAMISLFLNVLPIEEEVIAPRKIIRHPVNQAAIEAL